MSTRFAASPKPEKTKSLESWISDAACSIRGAKDAAKYKDYILPLIFTKRLCDVYNPPEVGTIMSRVLQPEPGMSVYDPTCGSCGLLVKLETAMEEKAGAKKPAPLKLFGQEYVPETWAMANMNMIIHDMEGQIEIGDTFKNPKFRDKGGKLRTFDRVVATARRGSAFSNAKPLRRASRREDNPMWNLDWFTETDYDADTTTRDSANSANDGTPQDFGAAKDHRGRFPGGARFPSSTCMHACLNDKGRGAGNAGTNKEKFFRRWVVDRSLSKLSLYVESEA